MSRCIPCVEKKLRKLLTEEKAKNAKLEAENKLMKDKARTTFGCFWNGGWYVVVGEEALWRKEEL